MDKKPTVRTVVAAEPDFDPCPEYDFDKDNAKDVGAVSDYAVDIFRYYKRREVRLTAILTELSVPI